MFYLFATDWNTTFTREIVNTETVIVSTVLIVVMYRVSNCLVSIDSWLVVINYIFVRVEELLFSITSITFQYN